jgi:GDP-L-fucose synthase
LETTNDAYAIAKIAGVLHIQAYRREYGRRWISAMPTNLYGPGDNFDLNSSHVLPAMIAKFDQARRSSEVTLWGTGSPRREFLHVYDLASAVSVVLNRYDDPAPINIGTGVDITIRELAHTVAGAVGFQGDIAWDSSKPDGTPRKLLDVSRLMNLGWSPRISLDDGIRSTVEWFRATNAQNELRPREPSAP